MESLTTIEQFADLVPLDHGLSVVVTRRADLSPVTSVVNAGVVAHPVTGDPAVAFVSAGVARKLAHLRADPTITVVVRAGWLWAAVEGTAELIGPDDPDPAVDPERLRMLLREIFQAAGGTHATLTPGSTAKRGRELLTEVSRLREESGDFL